MSAPLATAAGVITVALTIGGEASPTSVIEDMFETYNHEGPEAALNHFGAEEATRFRDHMSGLAVWNDRLTVIEPCRETSIRTIVCVMAEQHAFHEEGGLAPFENTFTFRLNDAKEISFISQSVPDHFVDY